MSELPGQTAPDLSDSYTPSRSALRRVGEYLLVAQLGDDALGSVYRALHTDGRFVRLRVLQSPELPPRAVLEAAGRQAERRSAVANGATARHCELQVANATPYLVWPETSGWTLDFILARARAGGWGMPVEFALLIAERASAQLEEARLSARAGDPSFHGALWPGFVSVSCDAEVRVEGFGLTEVILPSLAKPRMWRDIAPYIAPEVRETGSPDESSDVYSIGILLTELLTGQRASADTPPPRWRADDDFSQEVSLLLRFALGQRSERFASMAELHASLKELTTSCPFETSPADLALFLYDLLNPESRMLPAPFDGSSTNPVGAERRPQSPAPVSLSPATPLPRAFVPEVVALLAPPPEAPVSNDLILFGVPPAARSVSLPRWIARAAALAAAVAALFLLDPLIRNQTARFAKSLSERSGPPPARAPLFQPTAASAGIHAASIISFPRFSEALASTRLTRVSSKRPTHARARRGAEERSAAETLRLKAALARIEAERLDAPVHAPDAFRQGQSAEREAAQLLLSRQYATAREAYARALDFFTEAESMSRQERVRQIQISGDSSGP